MPSDLRVALVTGANQGIGLETVKRLAASPHNYHVLMGCRDPRKGEAAAAALRQQRFSVEVLLLDVTIDASIYTAAEYVQSRYGKLDVLINNAGISNDAKLSNAGASSRSLYQEQFDTNIFGVAQVTETFCALLKRSSDPRLVFVSSGLGSLSQRIDPDDRYFQAMLPIYRTSKAALNMLCLHYATKYKEDGWKVNAVDPGHVATNLNNYKGPDPVELGAVQIVRMATLELEGPTGTFSNKEGTVPW